MSARRLNDSEKQEIIQLYRQSGETTISLADRFGVSNSTIGRIIKNGMDNAEYDALVQQKRSRSNDAPEVIESTATEPTIVESVETAATEPETSETPTRVPRPTPRKRVIEPIAVVDEPDFDDAADADDDYEDDGEDFEPEVADPEYLELAAELGGVAVSEDEDEDDDFEDDDFEDDEDDFEGGELPSFQIEARDQLTFLPLDAATIPKVFYLVVDRGAELIAPPLRDFGELGEMSIDEAENRTLPLFDNHRVAKRFSNVRTQRVIKVPDNQLFYKTTRHLVAKGIKRFLLDGQVYTLP
jgi:transposase-like protein